MQSSSSKVEEEEEVEEEEKVVTADKLQQKFLNLQKEWDNFKRYYSSNPRRSRAFGRSHQYYPTNPTVQNSTSNLELASINNNISPRTLMSSLQNNIDEPYSEGIMWKMMKDSAAREILRDRRDAIERGSLKGRRRLFDNQAQEIMSEVGSVVSFDDGDDNDNDDEEDINGDHQKDDPFVSRENTDHHHHHHNNTLCLSGQKVDREKVAVAEKMSVNISNKAGRSYNMVIIKSWLAVVSVTFAICIIRYFGQLYYENNEVINLVPT